MNDMNMPFSPESMAVFIDAVSIMLKGMVGIFAFMLLFYLLVKALERVFSEG